MLIYGERLNFSLRSNRLPDFLQYVLKYLIIEFEDDSRFSYPFLAGQLRFQQNLIYLTDILSGLKTLNIFHLLF